MTNAPWMTLELESFRDTVRRFYEKELAPNEIRWGRQQHVDHDVWRKAGGGLGRAGDQLPATSALSAFSQLWDRTV
jgi:alkylation response protein AidB-like acyl-CoA dehydrogenase